MNKLCCYQLGVVGKLVKVDSHGLIPIAKFQFSKIDKVCLYVEVWSIIPDYLYSKIYKLKQKLEKGHLVEACSTHSVNDVHIQSTIADEQANKLVIYKTNLMFIDLVKIDGESCKI